MLIIKKILSRIKGYILLLPGPIHYLATRMEEAETKRVESQIQQAHWPDDSVISAENLIEMVKEGKGRRTTCHVIASGGSVLLTANNIPKHDYRIGFNLAALLPIDFDLYFFEYCNSSSVKSNKFSLLQASVIQGSKKIQTLVAKNIWEGKLSHESILQMYKNPPPLLRDIHLPYWTSSKSVRGSRLYAQRLLAIDRGYIRQAFTTTLTCIALAINAEFEKIIVHGYDMKGEHFYTNQNIIWPPEIDHEYRDSLLEKSRGNSGLHPASGGCLLFKSLQEEAARRGCQVLLAKTDLQHRSTFLQT